MARIPSDPSKKVRFFDSKISLSRLKAIVFMPFALAILVLKPEWFVPNEDYDDLA